VGTILAAGGFIALLSSFVAHCRLWASKKKAKQKIEEMENKAKEEDSEVPEASKLRRREVNWDDVRHTYRK
jgi:hypothetical protein